jgi:hypothetical protein
MTNPSHTKDFKAFQTLEKEDLLIKIKMLIAENTLHRKNAYDNNKLKAYIRLLEEKLNQRSLLEGQVLTLKQQVESLKSKHQARLDHIKHLQESLEKRRTKKRKRI